MFECGHKKLKGKLPCKVDNIVMQTSKQTYYCNEWEGNRWKLLFCFGGIFFFGVGNIFFWGYFFFFLPAWTFLTSVYPAYYSLVSSKAG